MVKRGESIGHGDIGEVGGDLVLLAESLELLPGEAMEIHCCPKTKIEGKKNKKNFKTSCFGLIGLESCLKI